MIDNIAVGKTIAKLRQNKNMTQQQLAAALNVSHQAVSKWETGKSMPDASIILELCALLHINVNELFTGERLDMERYKETAEEHLLELRRQEELSNKRLLSLETVIGYTCSVSYLLMIFAACYAVTNLWWRIALIAAGSVIFFIGVIHAVKLEHDAGYYECPSCGTRYVPSMKTVVFAPHIGRSRRMTCPYCGSRAYHKKVLTK